MEISKYIKDYPNKSNWFIAEDYVKLSGIGLPVDLLIDNNSMYRCYENEPCAFFRDSYVLDEYYLPISLVEEGNWVELYEKSYIKKEDLYEVYSWVRENRKDLLELANGRNRDVQSVRVLNEGRYLLSEMANIPCEITGLYDDIWIDNGGSLEKSGHAGSSRIKYRADNDKYYPLIVHDLSIPHKSVKDWPSKELQKLKEFVRVNAEIIELADKEHWPIKNFISKMCYYGKYGHKLVKPKEEPEYRPIRGVGFGFRLVKKIDCNEFNLEKEGKVLPLWFSILTPFSDMKSDYSLGFYNNKWYKIDLEGKITQTEF